MVFDHYDVKKCVVGIEKGKHGYEHFQGRTVFSGHEKDAIFDFIHEQIPEMHLEVAETTDSDYERKDGRF